MTQANAATPTPRSCAVCGTDMSGRRKDAKLCSLKCRNRARYSVPRQREPLVCTVVEDSKRCTNPATHRLTSDVWCKKHHARWERHGSPLAVRVKQRPKGEVQAQLRAAALAEATDCILLPNSEGGRLTVTHEGDAMTASRAVWVIANGNPGERHVLHTCHRGDEGCVNVRHLYLGDHRQNMTDMVESDRSTRGERHGAAKLTLTQVMEIHERYRDEERQSALATAYGVDTSTISNVVTGKNWGWARTSG
ncbi:hypothetical protein [Streptomyces sp. SPB074]|uniref:hypothetical protein n=1 Tax=Streptomyces sp. (strain SPB074) TaxID=465543 RepID=UPI001319FF18|nr:hypothetical protein [Streptomyces sp. SPB074]